MDYFPRIVSNPSYLSYFHVGHEFVDSKGLRADPLLCGQAFRHHMLLILNSLHDIPSRWLPQGIPRGARSIAADAHHLYALGGSIPAVVTRMRAGCRSDNPRTSTQTPCTNPGQRPKGFPERLRVTPARALENGEFRR